MKIPGLYISLFGIFVVNVISLNASFQSLGEGCIEFIGKVIGVSLLAVGAIVSYLQGITKEVYFSKDEYCDKEGGYVIDYIKFKKRLPIVRVFNRNEDGKYYEEIGVAVHYRDNGDVFIGSNIAFIGKVIIK